MDPQVNTSNKFVSNHLKFRNLYSQGLGQPLTLLFVHRTNNTTDVLNCNTKTAVDST